MDEAKLPFVLYWTVPCPDCPADSMQPCQDDSYLTPMDVHLARMQVFAAARYSHPEWGLALIKLLVTGDNQPK